MIISLSFGIGFALTISIVLGGFLWYQNKPKTPKPWDTSAITATYEYISTEGDDNTFVFHYILQNNTDFDYRISNLSDVVTMVKLKKQDSLSGFTNNESLTCYLD